MGTANTKSTIVTNADATPRTLTAAYLAHGRLREQVAKAEVAAADDNNSVYRMFRVHSSWRISELALWNDAITCGSDFNLGLYQTAENGGAVVTDNIWADAVSMASARAAAGPLDCMFEQLNIDDIQKRVWELAGLSADPNRWYDIAWIGIAVGTGAGGISMRMRYVDGS